MYISDGFDNFRKHIMEQIGHDISRQNIYLIQTEDMDGNITDEKYGVNLRTDLGMCDYDGTFVTIFLGSGTTQETYLDEYLGNINNTFTKTMSGGDGIYTTTFDAVSGMITTTAYTEYVTYDYNISGINTDITFTELGTTEYGGGSYSGYHYGKLTTHTLIYDQHGQVSSITKRLNEKLTIRLYKSFSIHESVIEDAYDRGEYILIDMDRASGLYRSGGTSRIEAYPMYFAPSRNESGTAQLYSFGTSLNRNFEDSDPGVNTANYSNTVISGSLNQTVIENSTYYFDKLFVAGPSSIILKKIKMDSPETLVNESIYTDNQSTGTITHAFGSYNRSYTSRDGFFPVTDFQITDSKTFNYKTGAWDIQDTIINSHYDDFRWVISSGSLFRTFDAIDPISQAKSTFYVAVNTDDTKALRSIWTNGGSTFYLAEKYWDTSTWVAVTRNSSTGNIDTIPDEAKYYRYLVSKGADPTYVTFYRTETYPGITDVFTPYAIENVPAHTRQIIAFVPIVSETYKWILIEEHILSMNNDGTIAYSHKLYGDSNNSPIDVLYVRAGFDNKLVVGCKRDYESTPRNIRIYDMTTMTSESAPSYVDVPLTFSRYDGRCHFTKTTAGYVAVWEPYDSNKRACIVDINTGTSVTISDTRMFHIQDFTTYAIYGVVGSSPFQFNVYNLSTNEVVDTFTIPAEHTESQFRSVCGCGDYFYIQFGTGNSQVVYMYTISTKQLVVLGGIKLNMCYEEQGYDSHRCNYPVEVLPYPYHRDGFVIIPYEDPSLFITTSDPLNPVQLVSDAYAVYGEALYKNIGMVSHIAEYSPDGTKTHLLLLDCANSRSNYNTAVRRHAILDLGLAFKTHSSVFNPYNHWTEEYTVWSGSNLELGGVAIYDGKIYVFNGPDNSKVYPLKAALPHKVTGQTYTYQQYNNPKSYNFAGKYNIARTNHGNITTMPSPPATFTISGAADGSGTGMRFKSWWRWSVYNNYEMEFRTANATGTAGAEFGLGLNKAFKVLPGNSITVNATLKSGVHHIDHIDVGMFVVEDNGTNPINGRIAYKQYLTGNIGSAITVPTGTYATQYLRIFITINAYDSSNNLVPIVATHLDTVSIAVT